jgi:hypothetical protein
MPADTDLNGKKILIAGAVCLVGYSNWRGILSGELLFQDPYLLPIKIIGNVLSTLGDIFSYFLN